MCPGELTGVGTTRRLTFSESTMQQTKKVDSILAEYSEETFEFSDPRQLPDGQIVTNVCNHSHEETSEHAYSLFFDAERENTIVGCHAEDCGCPADEYHEGPCKHRSAAAQCGELLGAVIETAVATEDEDSDTDDEHDPAANAIADGGVLIEPNRDYWGQPVETHEPETGTGERGVCLSCGSGHNIALVGGTDPDAESDKWEEFYRCACGGEGTFRVDGAERRWTGDIGPVEGDR